MSGHKAAMKQMHKVIETMRSQSVKIAVVFNNIESQDRELCRTIIAELKRILSGSKALVFEYVIKDEGWLQYLRSMNVTHYIFIGLPPHQDWHMYPARTLEEEKEFFNPHSKRIMEVVVVNRNRWATTPGGSVYTPVHYLEQFQHLEGSSSDIAAMALCHFAG